MNVGWPEAVISIALVTALVLIFFLLRRRLRKATVHVPGFHGGFEADEPQRLADQELQVHDSLLKNADLTMSKGVRTGFFGSKVKKTTIRVTGGDLPAQPGQTDQTDPAPGTAAP
ncbi:hypothetical protein AB0D99_19565 [Streptomyces sp. NPDC047971]|uniref:hypothetical protein n=1 Tax=Streptomyces sp. NPDC047971 TaxID=3154499 RepID=UPI003402A2E1